MASRSTDTARYGALLVLGATGLLGQAMLAEACARGWPCTGAARSGADHCVDVADLDGLERLLLEASPAALVNCAAITSLEICERHPERAYGVNARAPALLAELSRDSGIKFVQISSDHYFTGNGSATHAETASVRLLNEYARTKYAGEVFALTAPASLVVRTNIVGLRGWPGRPTFAEWALDALESRRSILLYDDFFTSSMHSRACAKAVLDLVQRDASGLINVASSQVSSKRKFVLALAEAAGLEPHHEIGGSVRELGPRRAESLGLDVERAERLLGRSLPGLQETVESVVWEHRRTHRETAQR
jgi:dTDP-4-dehydrorhamnose reductase